MSEWKEYQVKDLIEVIKQPYKPNSVDNILYLGLEHINEQTLSLNSIGNSKDIESNKFIFQSGDTLFGKLRPYFRKVYQPNFSGICSTDIWIFRNKNSSIDKTFLFYFVANPLFVDKVSNASTGTRMPRGDWNFIKDTKWLIPPLEEQRAIASTLSCLDAKIENLRKQNETLEAIAQTLFKHWFIDFEFPNEDGKPYKSSGGKMRSTELGEIPKDWQVGKLGDVLSLIIDYRGKTPKKLSSDWSLTGIPALSAKNIKDGKIIREESMYYVDQDLYNKWMKDELKKHDILLTSEAPLGEIYYLANNNKYVLSQRLFALRVKNNFSSPYLYQWLKSEQGQFLLNRRATGSTVQGIRQVELKKVEIIIPKIEILEKITKLWFSILEKMDANFKQIQTLTKTRDALLPKLMSGQLRVKG